eukprot:6177922-Lingulodinium_polyedra.AAC.1
MDLIELLSSPERQEAAQPRQKIALVPTRQLQLTAEGKLQLLTWSANPGSTGAWGGGERNQLFER